VAARTEASLMGQPWNLASLPAAYAALAVDLPLPAAVPGGQAEYRRALPPSFLFKFFVKTCQELSAQLSALPPGQRALLPPPPRLSSEAASASANFVTSAKPLSSGRQEYTVAHGGLTAAHAGQDPPPATTNQHAELPTSTLAPLLSDVKGAKPEGSRAPVGEPVAHLSAKKQVRRSRLLKPPR
jgi:xanthine dehydrogenase/oxidase